MQLYTNDISNRRIYFAYEVLLNEEQKADIDSLTLKKPEKRVQTDPEELYRECALAAKKYHVQGEAAMYMDLVDYVKEMAEEY